jgi:lipoprotein signal peptidase
MILETTTALAPPVPVVRKFELSPRVITFALLAAVVVVDQATKWWAWRTVSMAQINYGGNIFVGATVSGWYADPVTGALLDLVDFGLLSVAVAVLLRYSRSVPVLIAGALMIGGWSSNLLDRLGMHYLTAPGSVRGAVDFIPLGRIQYNVADLFIVGGTILFLLTVLTTGRSATTGSGVPTHSRPRALWRSTIGGAVFLIAVVGFGAVNYGGVTTPRASDNVTTRQAPAK